MNSFYTIDGYIVTFDNGHAESSLFADIHTALFYGLATGWSFSVWKRFHTTSGPTEQTRIIDHAPDGLATK